MKRLESKEGLTQFKPPSNEAGPKNKILVIPKEPHAKKWLFAKGPITIGEVRGHLHVLEREFGLKGDDQPDFKEYFLFGKKWNGRFVARKIRVPTMRFEDKKVIIKKPVYRWNFWKTKDQSRFVELLRELDKKGRKIPNKLLLFREYPLEEEFETISSFEWSMPLSRFKQVPEGVLIEGEAIGEEMTRNKDIFVYDELLEGARSLIDRPLELDHVVRDYGFVIDANFNRRSKKVEYQGLITNPEVCRLALAGKLRNEVSVRARWRKRPWVDGYKLIGLYFAGLSLLKDTPPAGHETSMKIVQKMFNNGRRESRRSKTFSSSSTLTCKRHGIIPLQEIHFNENNAPSCPQCHRQLSARFKWRKKA